MEIEFKITLSKHQYAVKSPWFITVEREIAGRPKRFVVFRTNNEVIARAKLQAWAEFLNCDESGE